MTRTNNNLLLTALLALGCGVAFSAPSYAANAPEISSSVWEEGNAQCASVSLSGKEVIAFRGASGGHAAEQRAEDLADKLQKLLEDSKIDFNNIVPAKDGDIACIRSEGTTILKLDGVEGTDGQEQSLKLVNAIRTANGAEPLPDSFIKVADSPSAAVTAATANAGGKRFSGPASWYGLKFHGRKCADGSRFDMNKLTAAHRFLPLGTKLLVMNRRTGDSCVVKVNDRGPFVGNRVIDLSRGAARQLNMLSSGVALVDCIVLGNN